MINCVWYLFYGLLNRAILLDLAHHIGLDVIVITLIVIFILKMKTEIVTFKLQVNTNGFGMSRNGKENIIYEFLTGVQLVMGWLITTTVLFQELGA